MEVERMQDVFPEVEDLYPETEKPWSLLFSFTLRSHLFLLGPAFLLSLTSGLVIPVMSLLMGRIFGSFAAYSNNELTPEELMSSVSQEAKYLLALGCVGWITSGAFFTSWLAFGESQARAARERLFEGMIGKDMEWFETRRNGVAGLISQCQTRIKELQNAVSQPMGYALQASVTASVSLCIAIYHSWSLTLVILAGVPVALLVLSLLSARAQPDIEIQKEHLSEAASTVYRSYSAIEMVKAFNAQSHELNLFSASLAKSARAYRGYASKVALQIGCIRFITMAMFVQGFWYGGLLVGRGKTDARDVMTTFWSCLMATQSFEVILPQLIALEKGRAAVGGLLRQIREGKKALHAGVGQVPHSPAGAVQFSNVTCALMRWRRKVSFAYPSRPGQLALDSADFSIPVRETTFIIGRSGSGKSTIGNLILKAYQPLSGNIIIDGVPLADIHPEWLRDNITLVQQQSVLFNETIFRNVAFGKKDCQAVTKEQVHRACRMVQLERALSEFPLGYDTIVGVGGKQLSGGQRQRVALARAILRDTEVLILDEATSSLDYGSRCLIMDAIREWRRGKTTIIITHDIAQIGPKNFVYILGEGKVIQSGYRGDLESRNGAFRSFMQASQQQRFDNRRDALIPELVPDDYIMESAQGTPAPGLHLDEGRRGTVAKTGNRVELASVSRGGEQGPHRRLSISRVSKGYSRISASPPSPSSKKLHPRWPPSYEGVRHRTEYTKIPLSKILGTIWPPLTYGYRILLLFGFAAAFAHGFATPLFSFALARLLLSFLDHTSRPSEPRRWSLFVLGVATADGLVSYLMHYLLESCGQAWIDHVRISALSRILAQPRVWFDLNSVSAVTEDLERNAEDMRDLVGKFIGYSFFGVVMVTVGVLWSFTQSWELTLVGLMVAPVMYAITRGFSWVSEKWEARSNQEVEVVGSIFEEIISNIGTVRALSLEGFFRRKYLGAIHIAARVGTKKSLFVGAGFGLSDSAILFATALIFYSGAALIARDLYDLEEILTVFTLLLFSLANANAIVGLVPQISSSKATATRVFRLAGLHTSSHEQRGRLKPEICGKVSFQSVSFAYPTRPDVHAISNLNLEIFPGERIAITGYSGSGKSTLAALLQRLYPPTSGTILLDDRPLETLDVNFLRSWISIVSQSPTLFGATVSQNISYGGWYSQFQIETAAREAGVHDFIMGLPEGYQTQLSNGGNAVSGGQAQKIAIARALVRRKAVLVLDECTSNLDSESANEVHESIARLTKAEQGGRRMTIILITHSREMMMCAERIVVMSRGNVVESGSFLELSEAKGELSRLLSRGELLNRRSS